MKQDHILSAIDKASNETAHFVGAHLRAEAHNSNWPEHVVRSMHVTHDKGQFNANVHESHHAEALNHEYGTPGSQPNAAIRRTANRTAEPERFLVNRLFQHIEDSL